MQKRSTPSIKEKAKIIKLVITDVDGVLTDGGLYYTDEGLLMKRFNVKDGMGTTLLRNAGIKIGIVSTDVSELIRTRAERLKMDFVYIGVWEKEKAATELCEKFNIKLSEVAFIGDDLNDKSLMKIAGLTACPADAVPEIKKLVDYKCKANGGQGAFREFVDLILKYQKNKRT